MNAPDPILITGCARSGTSIVAGIVHYCGAWGGDMTGRTRANQKGQFENKFIRDKITKPALRAAGYDPLGQNPLPTRAGMVIDPSWGDRVRRAVTDQGYQEGPWFYKGAKMCLFWWQWHAAFPDAKWIIVRREDAGIIQSCLKTGFMRAYRNARGWQKWIDVHKVRFEEMKAAGLDVHEVWPSELIAGKFGVMKTIVSHVGLTWNRNVIHDFVEPRLWHSKSKAPRPEVIIDGE